MSVVRSYLVAGVAATVLLGTAGVAAAAVAAAPSTASITVDTAHPGGSLAADFVGLSFEMRELGVGSFDPKAGNLAQLFKTLGTSNIRIGGNTVDRDTLW